MPAPIVKVPPRTRVLSWECFDRRYEARAAHDGTVLFDYADPAVMHALNTEPRRVWTVVDCDGALYVVPGLASVNYFARIVTERAWSDTEETNPGYRY